MCSNALFHRDFEAHDHKRYLPDHIYLFNFRQFSLLYIHFESNLDILTDAHYKPKFCSLLILAYFAVLVDYILTVGAELLPFAHLSHDVVSLLLFHINNALLGVVLFEATVDGRDPERRFSGGLVLPNFVSVSLDMTAFV